MKTLGLIVLAAGIIQPAFADNATPAGAPAAAAVPAVAPAASTPRVASAANVQVDKLIVGTAVENHEISGAATEFPASVERLYCWSKVTASNVPTTVKHVWYADGKKEAEVSLDVKYSSTRTWSSKSVWPGSWKVEAQDAAGDLLASMEFTVK
ncbi:MAG TPA: DUF2914 domain-containing protein [Elusimicrobiota bacterium]|nr:DUF2914 domain-containing protein [Elusimicrobiota bacterium]